MLGGMPARIAAGSFSISLSLQHVGTDEQAIHGTCGFPCQYPDIVFIFLFCKALPHLCFEPSFPVRPFLFSVTLVISEPWMPRFRQCLSPDGRFSSPFPIPYFTT